MGSVVGIHQILLSVSQIASEFGMARPTVSKRLDAAGIKPSDRRGGHPVYRMRDVIRIFVDTPQHSGDGAEFVDPMRMRPTDRRAWFQSENERLKFEQEQGRLIPAGEVEAEMAEVAKIVTRALETLPDRLERDMRTPAAVVDYVAQHCRAIREELHAAMQDEGGSDARNCA